MEVGFPEFFYRPVKITSPINAMRWALRIRMPGMNCANLLSSDIQDRVEHIIDELIESGLVPHRTMS